MTITPNIERLISLLDEKEHMLRERERSFDDQQEELLSQTEELNAAVEELMAKNAYLTATLLELKQRNEELDQILYRASHDLKTPVSSIRGLLSILQSGDLTPEQQDILGHLSGKTVQMEDLLAALTDLSTAFFHVPAADTVTLQSVLEAALARIKSPQHVSVDREINHLKITTDPILLKIALTCLIKNAVDYTRPGCTNEIQISAQISDAKLTITIADSGEEISAETEERMFEMFFRGSVNSKGPGLGLYIAQRSIEKLKGKIELTKKNGYRKQFTISIPATPNQD